MSDDFIQLEIPVAIATSRERIPERILPTRALCMVRCV